MSRKTVLALASIAVVIMCFGAWCLWLIDRPARRTRAMMTIVRQVRIGKTTTGELESELAKTRPADHTTFECQPNYCVYWFVERNEILRRLHLAPVSEVVVDIYSQNGVVTDLAVTAGIGVASEVAHFRFTQGQVTHQPEFPAADLRGCTGAQEFCITQKTQADGVPFAVRADFSDSAPEAVRNKLLQINANCLFRIGGCVNALELVPALESIQERMR